MKPTATYAERSATIRGKTIAAELERWKEVHATALAAAKLIQENAIVMANAFREGGLVAQAMCGHEKVDESFWARHCEGNLPFDFETSKHCQSLARKMPRKAKMVEEVAQYLQSSLVAAGVLKLPKKARNQNLRTINPIQRFLAEVTLMRQPFSKITSTVPVEQWDQQALDRLISETQWLADEREKALRQRAK